MNLQSLQRTSGLLLLGHPLRKTLVSSLEFNTCEKEMVTFGSLMLRKPLIKFWVAGRPQRDN